MAEEVSRNVEVRDSLSPEIKALVASPSSLWPPNHKMKDISLAIDASDLCDKELDCQIVSVTSNQDVNAKGSGKTSPDWEITGALSLKLRAERSGKKDKKRDSSKQGRVYEITVNCQDQSGNSTSKSVQVRVAHDQGKK